MLHLFTDPSILEQIGSARLAKFINGFVDDTAPASLPQPTEEPASPHYFAVIATSFANTTALPPRLLAAMSTLEAAASLEYTDHLNALIQRHIPNVSLNRGCPLDCALELWFLVPSSLDCFASSSSSSSSSSTPREGELAAPKSDEGGLAAPKLLSEGGSSIDAAESPSAAASTVEGSTAESAKSQSGGGIPGSTVQSPEPSTAPSASGNGTVDHELVAPKSEEGGPPPADKQIENQNREAELRLKLKNGEDDSYAHDLLHSHSVFSLEDVQPWPEPVNGKTLLDALVALLRQFVVLPRWTGETLALWIIHTYLFKTRDVTTYIGIESPEKRCGKTTLLTVLSELVSRPVVSTNISSPAFFRVIEEVQPTLLIDEADTFFHGNTELRGILNSGYKRKTSFVVRVTSEPRPSSSSLAASKSGGGGLAASKHSEDGSPLELSTLNSQLSTRLARFSCWCPKAMAAIGRFPDTLADRCIVIRMQRKTNKEECERLRNLETTTLRRQCARFALDNAQAVGSARPDLPSSLNDRAADIWEPLLAIADLAGGDWPQLARQAAVNLAASAQDHNPIGTLLFDIFLVFTVGKVSRIFSRELVHSLNTFPDRPWSELRKGKPITELWLAQQLRPYGVRPKTIWIEDTHAKGYTEEDFHEVFRRYIPKSELEALRAECRRQTMPENKKPESGNPEPPAPPSTA